MAKAKKYNPEFYAQVKNKPKPMTSSEITKGLGKAPKKPRKRTKYSD